MNVSMLLAVVTPGCTESQFYSLPPGQAVLQPVAKVLETLYRILA